MNSVSVYGLLIVMSNKRNLGIAAVSLVALVLAIAWLVQRQGHESDTAASVAGLGAEAGKLTQQASETSVFFTMDERLRLSQAGGSEPLTFGVDEQASFLQYEPQLDVSKLNPQREPLATADVEAVLVPEADKPEWYEVERPRMQFNERLTGTPKRFSEIESVDDLTQFDPDTGLELEYIRKEGETMNVNISPERLEFRMNREF